MKTEYNRSDWSLDRALYSEYLLAIDRGHRWNFARLLLKAAAVRKEANRWKNNSASKPLYRWAMLNSANIYENMAKKGVPA